jgi:anti-anti-sigma factor
MQISTRKTGDVSIIDLEGKMIGTASVALYETVQGLLQRGVSQILINVDGVDLMDSSGLGELGHAQRTAAGQGATVKLLNLGPDIRRTLDLAQLTGLFEVFDSEVAAVASFRS